MTGNCEKHGRVEFIPYGEKGCYVCRECACEVALDAREILSDIVIHEINKPLFSDQVAEPASLQ